MYHKKTRFEDVHPVRWKQTKPYAKDVISARKHADPRGGVTQSEFQQMFQSIMMRYNPAIMRLPRDDRPETPMDFLTPELSLSTYASSFWNGNRNVVAMDPALLDLLRETDAGDVPMDMVRWTHPLLYIALPEGNGISLPGDPNEVDGAYVDMRISGIMQIAITTRRTDVQPRRTTWPMTPEPVYFYGAEMEADETVAGFTQRCVEARVAELLAHAESGNLRKAAEEINAHPEHGNAAGRHVVSVGERNNAIRADRHEEGAEAGAKALGLIVNLMCYLSTEPELDVDYSPRPPAKLAQKASTGSQRDRRNARAEMHRIGVLPIVVAGRKEAVEAKERSEGEAGEGTASHWRRGHYHLYWTGPGRTVPRLNWVRPVIVRADKGRPEGSHHHPVQSRS
ncbi:hypothetical protein [uncultured Salinicola sp.]|uniref:hypothetical protein n=1 Tax=uncultured Salinicola sp. TaxID=1193542 RepID=UPI0026347D3B|nr:hypothetical protein [uncultured Salinicola sp.]|tara:strand:- start:3984 stop:5171 length:1188 start_codon:yes stop_codon:yes gene_type:complete